MAHLCHVTLANKAHLPPDHSAVCFSLKCRILCLLIKAVGLCGVHRGGYIRIQIFAEREPGSIPKSRFDALSQCAPVLDFRLDRQSPGELSDPTTAALGSNPPSMIPGGVRLAVINENNGSRYPNAGSHACSMDLTSKIDAAKRYGLRFKPRAGTVTGCSSVVLKLDDAAESNFVKPANEKVDELILVITGGAEEGRVSGQVEGASSGDISLERL
jgi:hypothetical protein